MLPRPLGQAVGIADGLENGQQCNLEIHNIHGPLDGVPNTIDQRIQFCLGPVPVRVGMCLVDGGSEKLDIQVQTLRIKILSGFPSLRVDR